ncbi:MAG: NAD(P)/FAD-dependent oxidoreductase [Candidatus Thorarchaeota archaeon]
MVILNPEAIIIGAGPAGLLAASEIAQSGHQVQVLEEHPEIGKPDHCAGLLSASGLKLLGLKPPSDVIQNRVSGARIFSPAGQSLLIERGRREALVINRARFDSWLADRARNNGADISTQVKVLGIQTSESHTKVLRIRENGVKSERSAQVIINAEGSRCQISKALDLPVVSRRNKLPAYQYEVKGADIDDDIVEMYYGRQIAPGFFAWLIPMGEGKARVGLAAKDSAKPRLKAAINHHPVLRERLKGATLERGFGGIVLVGLPVKRSFAQGILVVGDAAGMVKATTGGGVVMGGIAAQIAGKTVTKALVERDFSQKSMSHYERGWQSRILKDLRMMYIAQRALSVLSDKGLNSIIEDAKSMGLVEIVKEEGDMDMQRKVIARLMRNPRTFVLGLKALKYIDPFI